MSAFALPNLNPSFHVVNLRTLTDWLRDWLNIRWWKHMQIRQVDKTGIQLSGRSTGANGKLHSTQVVTGDQWADRLGQFSSYRPSRCCLEPSGEWWRLCTGREDTCGGTGPCTLCAPARRAVLEEFREASMLSRYCQSQNRSFNSWRLMMQFLLLWLALMSLAWWFQKTRGSNPALLVSIKYFCSRLSVLCRATWGFDPLDAPSSTLASDSQSGRFFFFVGLLSRVPWGYGDGLQHLMSIDADSFWMDSLCLVTTLFKAVAET